MSILHLKKQLFPLLMLERVLMPDIRRLREEIKPSETDEGDGTPIFMTSNILLTNIISNLFADRRHTNDQCLHEKVEIQTENLSSHQWQRSDELRWTK